MLCQKHQSSVLIVNSYREHNLVTGTSPLLSLGLSKIPTQYILPVKFFFFKLILIPSVPGVGSGSTMSLTKIKQLLKVSEYTKYFRIRNGYKLIGKCLTFYFIRHNSKCNQKKLFRSFKLGSFNTQHTLYGQKFLATLLSHQY